MVQSAKFWDKIAEKYAAKPVADEATYQKKLEITQSYFESDMKVLEFGCGTGSTALVHAPLVNSYTAIDISAKMIEIANAKLAASQIDNLQFEHATLEDYEDVSDEYEVVLGLSILHLMGDYPKVIKQVFRMLKPGGIFVTSTACIKEGNILLRLFIPLLRLLGIAPYVEIFDRETLEHAMTSSGFELAHSWVPPDSKMTYFLIVKKPSAIAL